MHFEKKNPVTSLMSDVATGTLREDIMDEKVMSAIVEIKVPVERTEEIIRLVWEVEKQLDTVVALGVGTRCDEDGEENVVAPILERLGYKLERAKTNIGLGASRQIEPSAYSSEAGSPREQHDDQHTAPIRRRGELPRRLRDLRHRQPRQERQGLGAEAAGSSSRWPCSFQPGEPGRRPHGGALRPCQQHESHVALESRHDSRLSTP